MKNTTINAAAIAALLTNADWDYETSGENVRENDMADYLGELSQKAISADDVNKALKYIDEKEITNEFLAQDQTEDINKYFAWHLADGVAHSKIDIPYTTVTFIASV